MPLIDGYNPTVLDKVAIAYFLKPLAVESFLMDAIFNIGISLTTLSAEVLKQVRGATVRCQSNSTTSKEGSETAKVVLCSSVCARDILSEYLAYDDVNRLKTEPVYSFINEPHAIEATNRYADFNRHCFLQEDNNGILCDESVAIMDLMPTYEPNMDAGRTPRSLKPCKLAHFVLARSPRAGTHPIEFTHESMSGMHNIGNWCKKSKKIIEWDQPLLSKEVSRQFHLVEQHQDHVDSLLLPDLLVKEASETLPQIEKVYTSEHRLPLVVYEPIILQNYLQYLKICCNHAILNPCDHPAVALPVAYRIRWLLLLFHTSIISKLSTCGIDYTIGFDTLSVALAVIDAMIDYALQPYFAAVEKEDGTTFNEILPDRNIVLSSKIAPRVSTFTSQNSGVTTNEVSTSDMKYSEGIVWLQDHLMKQIVDGLYGQVICGGTHVRDMIHAIYMCYFTPGSFDSSKDYLLKGTIKIPFDFSADSNRSFFAALSSYSSPNNVVDSFPIQLPSQFQKLCNVEAGLSDCSIADINSCCLKRTQRGISMLLESWGHNQVCTLSRCIQFNGALLFAHQKLSDGHTFLRLKKLAKSVLGELPGTINLSSTEISSRMKEHKQVGSKAIVKNGTINADGSAQSKTPGVIGGDYGARRRRAERILVTFDTREFDPLWAFLLGEAHKFNTVVSGLLQMFEDILLSPAVNLQHYCSLSGLQLKDDMASLQYPCDVAAALLDGFVPITLSSLACSEKLTLLDWLGHLTDQRNFLLDWLTLGYIGRVRLHLLSNPRGLIHAAFETFAMKANIPLEKCHLHCQIKEMETALQFDLQMQSMENFGCSFLVTDLRLLSGNFHERSRVLELLPENSATSTVKVFLKQIYFLKFVLTMSLKYKFF
jgi:hypothetical protein